MLIDLGNGRIIDARQQIEEIDRVNAEESLYEFFRQGWRYIDPAPFMDGWSMQAVAEHCEAVIRGHIRKLLINIPPRMSKSSLVSVALPAWTWAQSEREWGPNSGPHVQFMAASYA